MNILVPFADNVTSRHALDEALHMAQPGDRVVVIATVPVPEYYAVDVMPGVVWMQTCRAERRLAAARAALVGHTPVGVEVRYVRVQAREEAAAVVCAAHAYAADLVLFAGRAGIVGRVARWLGTVGAVARHVPCGVRVITHVPMPTVAAPAALPVEQPIRTHERHETNVHKRP